MGCSWSNVVNVCLIFGTAVIDRQFKGEIATAMQKLTTRALEAQVEAAVSRARCILQPHPDCSLRRPEC